MFFWRQQLVCSTAIQRDSLDIISTEQHSLTHPGQCLSGKKQSLAMLGIPRHCPTSAFTGFVSFFLTAVFVAHLLPSRALPSHGRTGLAQYYLF